MCGRFALSDTQQLSLRFEVEAGDERALIPRYNVAPSQTIPVIVSIAAGRSLQMMRWGFRPAWKNPGENRPDPINARAETLLERPMFRSSLVKRRCIIPADGFYEWQAQAGLNLKQPYFIHMRDSAVFGFAGLYTEGRREDEAPASSCAIITTAPNALTKPIHNRMPAILTREAENPWLDEELGDSEALLSLLAPFDADAMEAYAVRPLVSSVKNEGPELIQPRD